MATDSMNMQLDGSLTVEIVIRAVLTVIFVQLEHAYPFQRKIQPEEWWLYRNPVTDSYIPTSLLWPIIIIFPILSIGLMYLIKRNKNDLCEAGLAFTLALVLNGCITDVIKLIVGRPRPDFFYRCFPDGTSLNEIIDISHCSGDEKVIIEGRKSFPSGHSSFAFASLGWTFFYLCGKLQVFHPKGRGKTWRLLVAFTPLLIALCIALSRTCDYHHHWQDVLCGSLLGLSLSYLCYRQYYPCITNLYCDKPYSQLCTHQCDSKADQQHYMESQIKDI